MTFISYAQNYEDVMLYRALKDVYKGSYIDVGAQDPVGDSVTKAFYERGWRGVNIEPVEYWFNKLKDDRPEDINLQAAASTSNGKIRFYEILDSGLSTTEESVALRHAEQGFNVRLREVPAIRLDEFLESQAVKTVHFLKIDVEGAEAIVLEGLDLKRIRPWIILIEATEPGTQITAHHKWEHLLTKNEYEFVYFDGLNRFYIAREHIELKKHFSYPPNIFDGFIRYSEWQARQRLGRLEEEIASAQDSVVNPNPEVQYLQETLLESKDRIRQFEKELASMSNKVEELNNHIDYWKSTAEDFYRDLTALRASHSWRVTAPIRVITGMLRQFVASMLESARKSRFFFRRIVKKNLVGPMRFIVTRPQLRWVVKSMATRFPSFSIRLRTLILENNEKGLVQGGTVPYGSLPSNVKQLPMPAREIYDELRRTVEKNK